MCRTQATPRASAQRLEKAAISHAGHTVLGGLAGGVSGAAGALTSASVMPTLTGLIEGTGLPDPIKQVIGMVASTTLGSLVGGTAGAATAFNVDTNNRQLGSGRCPVSS